MIPVVKSGPPTGLQDEGRSKEQKGKWGWGKVGKSSGKELFSAFNLCQGTGNMKTGL